MVLAVTTVGSSSSPWLYLFAALAGGGGMQLLYQVYQRARHGSRDDAVQIARAAQDSAASSQQLFVQYKVELEDAKRQLSEYLDQLVSVNRELGAATTRIVKLEADLHEATSKGRQLREELDDALARRDELTRHVEELRERIHLLENPTLP